MTDNNAAFEELAADLREDPAIKEAAQLHEEACSAEEEDHCVVCNVRKALRSLMYVKNALDGNVCDCEECKSENGGVSELDIATSLVDDLESGLTIISVCQQAIQLLGEITNATAFLIAQNELGEDDGEGHIYDEDED